MKGSVAGRSVFLEGGYVAGGLVPVQVEVQPLAFLFEKLASFSQLICVWD